MFSTPKQDVEAAKAEKTNTPPNNETANLTSSMSGPNKAPGMEEKTPRPRSLVESNSNAIFFCKEERIIAIVMFFSVSYGLVRTFAPPPVGLFSNESGRCDGGGRCICPRETVCATTSVEMFFLAMARGSAYMDYPLYMLMFLSMARNLNSSLQKTALSEMFHFTRFDQIHRLAGSIIGVEVFWHSFWHLLRWGLQGNIRYAISNQTGVTGLISLAMTPLVILPMKVKWLRQKLSFEVRKSMHYLSFVWLASILFHAPMTHIFWVLGTCFTVYILDHIYGLLISTRLVPSAHFCRVGNSVVIRMKRPKGFERIEGTYCYLCVPWVSKFQWHAFSLFKDPFDTNYLLICATTAGGWTRTLHENVQQPIMRRCWLYGPFSSPFQTGFNKDNLLCVATGVGVTTVLNAIQAHALSKKVSLIWICRDASLVEFVLDFGFSFCEEGYSFICYTGKQDLMFARELPDNVFLLKGRPDLESITRMILRATSSGSPYDLFYGARQESVRNRLTDNDLFHIEMRRLRILYSPKRLFAQMLRCSRHPDDRHIRFEHLCKFADKFFIHSLPRYVLKAIFEEIDEDDSKEINYKEFHSFMAKLDGRIKTMHLLSQEKSSANLSTLMLHSSRRISFTNSVSSRGGGSTISYLMSRSTRQLSLDEETGVGIEHSCENLANNDSFCCEDQDEIRSWKIMYCGENQSVIKTLKKICSVKNISFAIESFQW